MGFGRKKESMGMSPSGNTNRLATLIALLALGLCAPGCLSGSSEATLQSVEDDKQLGEETAKQIEEEIGVFASTKADAYLDAIGAKLVANLKDRRFTYRFSILDQVEPNAFAAPGGFVYFSRGILALAESEDELAGVMGHEIFHVIHRHSARQMARSRFPGLLSLPGRVVGSVVSENLGSLLNAPVNTVGAVVLAGYSREQESESDESGTALAARSGYDPAALAPILARLEREAEVLTGEKRKKGFLDSHPMTPDRVEDIDRLSAKLTVAPGSPIAADRAEFLGRLDGLLVGENPEHGVFEGRRYLNPRHRISMVFPDGWETVVTPRAAGAMKPEGDGLLFLGRFRPGSDTESPKRAFAEKLANQHRVRPVEDIEVAWGEWKGHLLTYVDRSGRRPMNLHMAWLTLGDQVFQMMGTAPEAERHVLRAAAQSLKAMTDAERDSVKALTLRLATARAGETLDALSKRTGNAWPLPMLAVVNGHGESDSLKEGELVKIAVLERWRP
jgi:predicted Zn-dependent protease